MMRKIIQSNLFKKDLEKAKKKNLDISLLNEVITRLANYETLEPKYNDHPLKGKLKGLRECHIKPDWLLVWQQNDEDLILLLLDTGSHADLFGK